MPRTQITLDTEMQRKARERATHLGVSLAEYVRRLVARDIGEPQRIIDPSSVFNLGRSQSDDVAQEKDAMIGQAVATSQKRRVRR